MTKEPTPTQRMAEHFVAIRTDDIGARLPRLNQAVFSQLRANAIAADGVLSPKWKALDTERGRDIESGVPTRPAAGSAKRG